MKKNEKKTKKVEVEKKDFGDKFFKILFLLEHIMKKQSTYFLQLFQILI